MNSKLRDILAAVYLAGIENGLGGRIVDPEEIVHRREAFVKGNPAATEAEKAIRQAVGEEMLKLVDSTMVMNRPVDARFAGGESEVRIKLRQKIKEWSQL